MPSIKEITKSGLLFVGYRGKKRESVTSISSENVLKAFLGNLSAPDKRKAEKHFKEIVSELPNILKPFLDLPFNCDSLVQCYNAVLHFISFEQVSVWIDDRFELDMVLFNRYKSFFISIARSPESRHSFFDSFGYPTEEEFFANPVLGLSKTHMKKRNLGQLTVAEVLKENPAAFFPFAISFKLPENALFGDKQAGK